MKYTKFNDIPQFTSDGGYEIDVSPDRLIDCLRACGYGDTPRQKTMKMNINDLKSKAKVLRWYIDFNKGGTVHSDEEISRVKALLKKERVL